MEYLGTALVAFVAALISGRLWLTVGVVGLLSLLGYAVVVGGELNDLQSHGVAVAAGLGVLIVLVFGLVATAGAWAGVAMRRRFRST